jgi:hypothetical protein
MLISSLGSGLCKLTGQHDWSEWQVKQYQCVKNRSCKRCGFQEETSVEHLWGDSRLQKDKCIEKRICNRCHMDEARDKEHEWGSWGEAGQRKFQRQRACLHCKEINIDTDMSALPESVKYYLQSRRIQVQNETEREQFKQALLDSFQEGGVVEIRKVIEQLRQPDMHLTSRIINLNENALSAEWDEENKALLLELAEEALAHFPSFHEETYQPRRDYTYWITYQAAESTWEIDQRERDPGQNPHTRTFIRLYNW